MAMNFHGLDFVFTFMYGPHLSPKFWVSHKIKQSYLAGLENGA
jgi:hypothetical protein